MSRLHSIQSLCCEVVDVAADLQLKTFHTADTFIPVLDTSLDGEVFRTYRRCGRRGCSPPWHG